MTYYLPIASAPGTMDFELSDVLPPGMKARNAWKAITPVVIHAKPYGFDVKKPFEVVAYAVGGSMGDQLLIKLPAGLKQYGKPTVGGEWDEVYTHQTTEGYRLTRSVIKVMKVLVSLAKKAHIERNKVARNRAAAKAREGRDGTCQICEGAQILQPSGANKGTLVLHGYERPGWGYAVGQCYGYHRKPFEVACDALIEWVASLKKAEAFNVKALEALPTRTSFSLKVHNYHTGKDEMVDVGPDDIRFERAKASVKHDLESSIRQVRREIDYHTARLEQWAKDHA